jgi:hypothetical protein
MEKISHYTIYSELRVISTEYTALLTGVLTAPLHSHVSAFIQDSMQSDQDHKSLLTLYFIQEISTGFPVQNTVELFPLLFELFELNQMNIQLSKTISSTINAIASLAQFPESPIQIMQILEFFLIFCCNIRIKKLCRFP